MAFIFVLRDFLIVRILNIMLSSVLKGIIDCYFLFPYIYSTYIVYIIINS